MSLFGIGRESSWTPTEGAITMTREATKFPEVCLRLGWLRQMGIDLPELAGELTETEVDGAEVHSSRRWQDRNEIPVVAVRPGRPVRSSMGYPTPNQVEATMTDLEKRGIRAKSRDVWPFVPYELGLEEGCAGAVYVMRRKIGDGTVVSYRPHIVVPKDQDSWRTVGALVNGLVRIGWELNDPVQLNSERQKQRARSILAAYAAEAMFYQGVCASGENERYDYGYDHAVPVAIQVEAARRLANGGLYSPDAFNPDKGASMILGELGLRNFVFGSESTS